MSELVNMRPDSNGLVDLIALMASKKEGKLTMIEIGSYQGESMEIFAKSGHVQKIICIDPWKSGYDNADVASKSDMNKVEAAFDERAAAAKEFAEVVKHKGTIDTFIKSEDFCPDIDFVYIDACHRYEGCKHDIEMCINAVKPTIAYSGHDFVDGWCGVKKAVNELLGEPD